MWNQALCLLVSVCPSLHVLRGRDRTCSFLCDSRLCLLNSLSLNLKFTAPDSLMQNAIFCIFQDQTEPKLHWIKSLFIIKFNVIIWFATKSHCLYFPMDLDHTSFPGIRSPNLYAYYKDYTIYILKKIQVFTVYSVSIQSYTRLKERQLGQSLSSLDIYY